MHKMTSISLKIVEVVILSENCYHFVSCSAWDKSCVKWDNSWNSTQKMRTIETTTEFQRAVLEFTAWSLTTLKLLLSALLVVSFWPKNVLSPTNSQQFFYSDLLQRLEHQLFRPWGDPWIIWDCQCSATGVADASLLLSFSTQLRDFKNKRIASKCFFGVLRLSLK